MSFTDATFSVEPPMADPAPEGIDNDDSGTKVKTEPLPGGLEPATDSPSLVQGNIPLQAPPQDTPQLVPQNSTADQKPEGAGDGDTNMADAQPPTPTTKVAPSRKKKGTATAVKAPKKGRASGGKKAKSAPKKKKAAPGAGASSPTAGDADDDDEADDDGGEGDSGSEESDHGPYCVCRGPDDHRWMIQCDGCEDWFHGECVHITKEVGETLIQSYVCPNCTDEAARYVTRYKKTCALDGCARPARVYAPRDPSVFCSQDHCNVWWEQLVAALPRARARDNGLRLAQEEFMGLLASSAKGGDGWKLGDTPYGTPTLPLSSGVEANSRSRFQISRPASGKPTTRPPS